MYASQFWYDIVEAGSTLGGSWEEGMSESWMVCAFLEELLRALGSLVTLLQVLLFADAHKPIVDFVQHDKPACFPSLF